MMLLDTALVRSAPEMASLEILAGVLEATLVALVAAHPCLESDGPCACALAPCRFADAIHVPRSVARNASIEAPRTTYKW